MNTPDDRWTRADKIFEAALDLPPGERSTYLAGACGDDSELLALVERLLAAAEVEHTSLAPGGGLEGPLFDDVAEELTGESPCAAGTRIGPWRIVRELGRGGMAVVYLAQRDDGQFRQRSALKLIKRGTDTDEVIRRFHQERQILALIRHPAIAQLIDGGVSAGGQPYFAMEYVEGQPIDRYCDEQRLSVSERLRLFLRIAQAVDHAHRNLIVHRDIKPSNILVTAEGHPKLLDFGIAKLLDTETTPQPAALTRTLTRVLTPAYASPEQIRGGPVTTASDVYQLGLLLYLLLTGRWPYRSSAEGSGDMAQAICEQDPTRPSTVIGRAAGHTLPAVEPPTPEVIGQTRRTSPLRLRRQLAGDLDKIVLMALRKEPTRRYPSVAQLIEDVARYLDGRPVAAQGEGVLYRTGKLLRRHAAAAVTAAAALVLILTLAVVYTVQLAQERDRAQQAAARATQVSDFLRGLFAVSAPTRSRGEQITARQLLDQGAERIESELADQPELKADLMTLMGDVYRELALYREARPLLERAEALRRSPGEDPRGLAASIASLAQVLAEEGELNRAQALFEEALDLRQQTLGAEHPDVARTLGGLGRVLLLQGDFEGARRLQEQALEILERALGPDDPEVGRTLMDLGAALERTRDFEPAKEVLSRAVRVLESGWDPEHPILAQARVYLGDALRFTGDPDAAQAQYQSALEILEHVYGPDHPEVASVLTKLGNLLNAVGTPDLAIPFHERALAIRQAAFGPQHALVAGSLNNLGLCYLRKRELAADRSTAGKAAGDLDAARRYLEQSVAAHEAALGSDHPEVAKALLNLAGAQAQSDDPRQALPLLERVLEIRERAFGPDHSLLASPLLQLGTLQMELGNPAAAEPLLRRALALGRDQEPYRHPEIIRPRIALGRCLTALKRWQEAEEVLSSNLAEAEIDLDSRRLTLEALISLEEIRGRNGEAEQRRRELANLLGDATGGTGN